MPTLVSVNVGLPRGVAWNGVTVHTGAWKDPVDGARMVRRLGVEGDGQGDTYGHGGPHRAVLVYQVESYEYWREQLRRDDLAPGTFAENLTVEGLSDDEVCIGDRYRIGEAEFEVSQPRVTCFRAGLRIGEPELAAKLVAHHRPGFYMRVISEGRVRPGDQIVRIALGPGRVSVAAVDALLYLPGRDLATLRRAVRIPALSPGWQTSLRQLLDDRPVGEPAWPGFRELRVTAVVRESPSVSSVHLAALDGTRLPAAGPGQYLAVRVPAAEPAPVRSYSLSSAPGADTYRISVKREPGGVVSGYLHQTLRPGALLQAAAPRGEFVLDDGAGPVVLVSAGIGVTPVLAMLHQLADHRSEREVWWLHAARRSGEQVFAAEARDLLAALPRARARVYYSRGTGRSGDPHMVAGRLSAPRIAELDLPPGATAYVCGPSGFIADVTEALRTAGLDGARIRSETFGTLAPITPGVVDPSRRAPHPPPGAPGGGPLVTFARSGVTAGFDTERASVLELAEACDVPTRWQCRSGVCRTCETPLLSGEVDYTPAPLDAPAPGSVLLCCARPRTALVLDV
ncbi:MOSC and FAD-binding oxidoreductase domain-containing protein [Pseudonocardia zijingensis]|uniref:MOSC and FAD-binding oxidoreductase domain-containing protein n=1 Tax=Pseudonocardia zijingensis TaxID=153376 RepID=A0ABN1NGU7_9PSEU